MPICSVVAGLIATVTLAQQPPVKPPAVSIPAKAPAAAPVKLPKNIVARVGGRDISRDELIHLLQVTAGRKLVLDLVQRAIVEQEAKRTGIVVPESEVAAKLTEEKAKIVRNAIQQTGEPMTFAQVSERFGITEGEVAWGIRLNLLARKTFAKSLEKQVPGLNGQRKFAHILIATIPLSTTAETKPPTDEEQKKKDEEAKARVEQILADIKASKLTFENAAKQFSDDKGPDGRGSAGQGGELPWVGRGVFDPDFEKAGFALQKEGEVTDPVKSRFGYHLIKLLRKGENATPAEKKKFRDDQINARVANPNEFSAWLVSLTRKAKVIMNPTAELLPAAPSRREPPSRAAAKRP